MNDNKRQIVDLLVTTTIFTSGCIVGKIVSDTDGGSWIWFNAPAIGILAVGELVWWRVRKTLFKGDN